MTATQIIPVLFMTNSEYGQANVVLATALEVARNPAYSVHFAAFTKTKSRIVAINEECKFIASPIKFHEIKGPSLEDLLTRVTSGVTSCTHPPGFWPAIKSYRLFCKGLLSWEPQEYVETVRSCLQIIRKVKPASLVIENALVWARDAARTLGIEFQVMAPCGPKEIVGPQLPGFPNMLRWPMPSSGYQFPLSFVDRLKNISLSIAFIISLIQSSTIPAINKARRAAGIEGPHPFQNFFLKEGVQYLLPYVIETEYADLREFELPPNILPCGPITLPALDTKEDNDAELSHWLAGKPTVLVNLGSIWTPGQRDMLEMLRGLQHVLVERPDIQILWKVKEKPSITADMNAVIQEFESCQRLKITHWLKTNPSVIVENSHVICSVHHGGANSYYEACKAGVTQLVLPVWIDTYEFAERARHLGVGLIGNVDSAPGVESRQLGTKLLRVLNEHSFKLQAAEVQAACIRKGEGREVAASEIMRWAQEGKSDIRSASTTPSRSDLETEADGKGFETNVAMLTVV